MQDGHFKGLKHSGVFFYGVWGPAHKNAASKSHCREEYLSLVAFGHVLLSVLEAVNFLSLPAREGLSQSRFGLPRGGCLAC